MVCRESTKAIEDNSEALRKAQVIADERKSLQDELNGYQQQYNELTMTSAQLLKLQKDALDASNYSVFDDIQAIKLKIDAKLKADAAEIESARLVEQEAGKISAQREDLQSKYNSLVDEYNGLTMTSSELLAIQKSKINLLNVDVFDNIQLMQEKITVEREMAAEKKAIEDQGKALQSELNDLRMTESDRLILQSAGIAQINKDIYDQIVAIKTKNQADEDALKLAEKVADERKVLQDEIDKLTMIESDLYEKRKKTYYGANHDLVEILENTKKLQAQEIEAKNQYLAKIAEQKKIQDAIDSEKASLQAEYNQLTMTEIELMELKRSTLNASNRDLFDSIQAEKLRKSVIAESAAAAATSARIEKDAREQRDQEMRDQYKNWIDDLKSAFGVESDVFKNTIDRFSKLGDKLLAFKDSLSKGSLSLLSPEAAYLSSKSKFEEIYAQAKTGDEKALDQFESVATDFRDMSLKFNASGEGYFVDLEKIKKASGDAAISAYANVDVAKLQLTALEKQVAGLIQVNESVRTVAQILAGGSTGYASQDGGYSVNGKSLQNISGIGRDILENLRISGGSFDQVYGKAEKGDQYSANILANELVRWSEFGMTQSGIDNLLGEGALNKLLEMFNVSAELYKRAELTTWDGREKTPVFSSKVTPRTIAAANDKETIDLLKQQNKLLTDLVNKTQQGNTSNLVALNDVSKKLGNIESIGALEASR